MPNNLYDGEGIIRRAGMILDRVEIELKTTINPILDWETYEVPLANQKEFLAIALIALTNNRRVFCSISEPLNPGRPGGPFPAPWPRTPPKTLWKIGLVA